MNKIEPHVDDVDFAVCSDVIGLLVVPGDAPGLLLWDWKPREAILVPLSYAKNGLSQLSGKDASEWTMIEVTVDATPLCHLARV